MNLYGLETSQDFNILTCDQESLFPQFYLLKCRDIRAEKIRLIIGYSAFQYSKLIHSFFLYCTIVNKVFVLFFGLDRGQNTIAVYY